MIVYYGDVANKISDSKVTIKDYYKTDKRGNLTTSVKYIETNNGKTELEEVVSKYERYKQPVETVYLPVGLTIDGKQGDDSIYGTTNNSTIYGGLGNDEIHVAGTNNIIYGGKGNDNISDYEPEESGDYTNTVVFNNGDGNDRLTSWYSQTIIKFADINSGIKLEKFGTDLILKYNSNKDSITIGYNFGQDIEFGDIYILDDDNVDFWANDGNYKGIVVKNNTIETINCNNKTISSVDIANLAVDISCWLITDGRDYADVQSVIESNNQDDITSILTCFSENTYWFDKE